MSRRTGQRTKSAISPFDGGGFSQEVTAANLTGTPFSPKPPPMTVGNEKLIIFHPVLVERGVCQSDTRLRAETGSCSVLDRSQKEFPAALAWELNRTRSHARLMANHHGEFAWLNELIVGSTDVAAVARRNKVAGIVVFLVPIDVIGDQRGGAALPARPDHGNLAPVTRVGARTDLVIQDCSPYRDVSVGICQRMGWFKTRPIATEEMTTMSAPVAGRGSMGEHQEASLLGVAGRAVTSSAVPLFYHCMAFENIGPICGEHLGVKAD